MQLVYLVLGLIMPDSLYSLKHHQRGLAPIYPIITIAIYTGILGPSVLMGELGQMVWVTAMSNVLLA